jgi:hypothetical protein
MTSMPTTIMIAITPRDGQLIKAVDMLAAYMETYLAIKNGSANQDLIEANHNIKDHYQNEIKAIGGIDLRRLYYDFD